MDGDIYTIVCEKEGQSSTHGACTDYTNLVIRVRDASPYFGGDAQLTFVISMV